MFALTPFATPPHVDRECWCQSITCGVCTSIHNRATGEIARLTKAMSLQGGWNSVSATRLEALYNSLIPSPND